MPEILISTVVAAVLACVCVHTDVRRRQLPARVAGSVSAIVVFGLVAASCAPSFKVNLFEAKIAILLACVVALAAIASLRKMPVAVPVDIAAPAIALGCGAGVITYWLMLGLRVRGTPGNDHSVLLVWVFEVGIIKGIAAFLIFWFLWREGRATMQWQRPNGLVAGEFLVLSGAILLATSWLRYGEQFRKLVDFNLACLASLVIGLLVIAASLIGYFRRTEEHRILDRTDLWGQAVQPEYTPPTPECPNPQRWRMYDSMTAELETLQFLKTLMTTMKPNLVVETGSFAGMSTIAMAEGIAENGFGRIVSCELDQRVFRAAAERIEKSGLRQWVDFRNESSLEMTVDGTIDILFSDSEQSIREREVRRFLPQMSSNGLILIHDAASCYDFVRKGSLRMEQEGLISVVLMPTARGLVIAQKRAGRK
jgi:hypothetical protein